MGLIFWWIFVAWVVGIALYWVVRYIILKQRAKKHDTKTAVPIAHSNRLTDLPEYKEALKRYRLLLKLAVAAMSVALLMAIVLSARPSSITLITPAQESRDIMLCLDVSGSVLRADAKLVNRFNALVNGFTGQRFGMTVFNSSSAAIIPLSDDYPFVNGQLKKIGEALTTQKGAAFDELTSGTLADFDKGTSLVSDGLTSCINDLGENPQLRSQSVILATDNEANGTPIIKPEQSAKLAEQKNIRIYAIDPGESESSRAPEHSQLKSLAEKTGGGYHVLSEADAVASIIDDISSQEAKYAATTPVVAISDTPRLFLFVAFIATVATVVLGWKLQL